MVPITTLTTRQLELLFFLLPYFLNCLFPSLASCHSIFCAYSIHILSIFPYFNFLFQLSTISLATKFEFNSKEADSCLVCFQSQAEGCSLISGKPCLVGPKRNRKGKLKDGPAPNSTHHIRLRRSARRRSAARGPPGSREELLPLWCDTAFELPMASSALGEALSHEEVVQLFTAARAVTLSLGSVDDSLGWGTQWKRAEPHSVLRCKLALTPKEKVSEKEVPLKVFLRRECALFERVARFRVAGLGGSLAGFRVSGFGFRVSGFGFRVWFKGWESSVRT